MSIIIGIILTSPRDNLIRFVIKNLHYFVLEADKVLNEGGGNDYSTSSENNLEKAAREDANGFIKAFSKTLTEHKESGGNDYANIVQDEDCPEILSLKIEDSYNIQCGRERENNPCDKTKHSHFRTICGVCNNMENRLINRNWIEN